MRHDIAQSMKELRNWYGYDGRIDVDVYRNLRNGMWSVKNRLTGLVIGWVSTCMVQDATLVVQPAGNQRVRDTGRKNVHAFVRGNLQLSYGDGIMASMGLYDPISITYDPYEYRTFVRIKDESPIHKAPYVELHYQTGVTAYVERAGAGEDPPEDTNSNVLRGQLA